MTNVSPKTPLVSVLTTSYNREAYIAETIESVLAQTMTDFEYIIVDDCSKDRTFEIAQSYARKDSRIRVYRNETNLGDYPNRNKAASYASGTYLKYVDSDDLLYPHCLEVMTRCIQAFPDAAVGLSAAGWGEKPYPLRLAGKATFLFNYEVRDLFGRSPGSSIIGRQQFQRLNGFTGLSQVGDFEMWLRLAKLFPVVVMPRDLMWYRLHDLQVQNEDSVATKFKMKMDVLHRELRASDCPLESIEVDRIFRRIKHQEFANSLKSVTRGAVRRLLGKWSG